jgi:methionyl-tRNA synthetase
MWRYNFVVDGSRPFREVEQYYSTVGSVSIDDVWLAFGSLISVAAVVVFVVLAIFAVALKGWALWVAAKRDSKWWFIAILLINTLGILELVYLIFFAKVFSGFKGKVCELCEKECNHKHHDKKTDKKEEKSEDKEKVVADKVE